MYNDPTNLALLDRQKATDTSNRLCQHTYLQITIELAKKLGLNEAIVLQQLLSLIERSRNFLDGYYWVHKTYD